MKPANICSLSHQLLPNDSPMLFSQKGALLERQPSLGRIVPEAERSDVRELFYKKYRLIYRVVSDTEILMLTLHPALRPLVADSLFE